MTTTTQPAGLDTALTYHKAWTSGNLDEAMKLVADDIVCREPDGEIVGKDAYRGYLSDFVKINLYDIGEGG